MSLFPRAARFNDPKPSDVPPPGAYNPKIHGPEDDAWRKGAIEIAKAPRGKENAPAPDTFGLYNPDSNLQNKSHSRRPLTSTTSASLAASTAAVQAKDKELARLSTSLAASQSSLSSINSKLTETTASLSTTQRDLRKSEAKNTSLEEKVARLERRFEGVKALQTNFEALRAEHEKSKAAREKELARVSAALVEKEEVVGSISSRLQSSKDAYNALAYGASKVLRCQIASSNDFLRSSHTVALLESRLRLARSERKVADRAAQVTELAEVVTQLENRLQDAEDDCSTVSKDSRIPWRHLRQSEDLHSTDRREALAAQDFVDAATGELFSLLLERVGLLEKERSTLLQRQSNLEDERLELLETRAGLEGALGETLTTNDTFVSTIKSLRSDVSSLEAQLSAQQATHSNLEQAHASITAKLASERQQAKEAKEAWDVERETLQAEIKEKEKERVKEAEARQRLAKTLGISRQAENALKEELQEMQGVSGQLAELQTEHTALQRSHSKLAHLHSATAAHADNLSSLNSELVSHGNNAQKVKVLDRLRREGREEREMIADLESRLEEQQREVARLTKELKAYQAVGTSQLGLSRSKNAPVLVRVSRSQDVEDDLVTEDAGDDAPTVVDAEPEADRRASRVRRASSSSWGRETGRRATRASMAPQVSLVEEESVGAIRMDGLMTLDELR